MRDYARQRTSALLERFGERLQAAGEGTGAGPIHDLRVAIRRLSGGLRIFAPLYPNPAWKKLRMQLARLMAAAGAVRDCDVALELLAKVGKARSAMAVRLRANRRKQDEALRAELARWQGGDRVRRWRRRLEL